jgi:Na+/H+ antiporter NhaC
MDDYGAISLIPTLIVFVLAILTRRPIESLLAGALVGLGIINGMQFVAGFADAACVDTNSLCDDSRCYFTIGVFADCFLVIDQG